jgi:peptidoglycan/LPS O-acetylase OafA/YrhL
MSGQAMNVRGNNFGILRILFAALVVVSHSPEIIDGNRSREIMTRLFGTISLGEFAVDGFFLVSGYLITKSFSERPKILPFAIKRAARIAPGYLVSFWVCALMIAPFVGAYHSAISPGQLANNVTDNLMFSAPSVAGAFHGLPWPYLNGSMWTIIYEVRCYYVVAVAGSVAGILHFQSNRSRWMILAVVLVLLIVNGTGWHTAMSGTLLTGDPETFCRYCAVFGAGALFYLFRDRIALTRAGAAGAFVLLLILLFHKPTAEAGVALFGGYLMFWFALEYRQLKISAYANRNDISYGLYLYAWPIQSIILWNYRTINPWMLSLLALIGAGLAGYASWHLVEKHCLAFAHRINLSYAKHIT